ncbi:MAG: hypothetical protein ATN32_04230 [Candidatus Epulonipiscium fishelsonii]|nr:MAG: hypothetical protein ATN32_04230 [Epulopiscium sp. AS2M-Bin002]
MQISEIITAVSGKCLNPEKIGNNLIKDITLDSRKNVNLGLFIPLIGEKFDAHDYIAQVYDKGVIATLTSINKISDEKLITILVKDTKQALLDLAEYVNSKFDRKIIAITGSVGKTTTKEMVSTVLASAVKVHKTEGNFNNEVGLPLTIFKTTSEDKVSVLEMGMNHFGEISKLTKVAKPDIAIITNIGTSHIENLGSREGILKAKLEILEGLKPDGKVLINGDEPLLVNVAQNTEWITYGLDKTNQYYATNIKYENISVSAYLHTPNDTYEVTIPSPGEHMVKNTLVAVAVAEMLKLDKHTILEGIKSYKSEKMRMQISTYNDVTIIDDTYNASVDSMKAALQVLNKFEATGRKVAVLGDMFELGEHSIDLHQQVGEEFKNLNIDCLYTVGNYASEISNKAKKYNVYSKHFMNKEEFLKGILENIKPRDVILLKASRGMGFEKIVESIKKGE